MRTTSSTPGRGGQVEHRLDDALAVVGSVHGRQRQRDVVEGDGEPHAREQQLRQGRAIAQRVEQGLADGLVGIIERIERFGGVDDTRPPGRQPLEAEPLAVPGQDRRGGAVDGKDESGTGHDRVASYLRFSPRRSNATFTAPRRPAAAACSMASA